jgi:hypothetical protein
MGCGCNSNKNKNSNNSSGLQPARPASSPAAAEAELICVTVTDGSLRCGRRTVSETIAQAEARIKEGK